MRAISKVNKIDPYTPRKKVQVGRKVVEIPFFFCEKDEEIEILTKNAGAWCIVVAAKNSKGQCFSINWNEISIPLEDIEFSLE